MKSNHDVVTRCFSLRAVPRGILWVPNLPTCIISSTSSESTCMCSLRDPHLPSHIAFEGMSNEARDYVRALKPLLIAHDMA